MKRYIFALALSFLCFTSAFAKYDVPIFWVDGICYHVLTNDDSKDNGDVGTVEVRQLAVYNDFEDLEIPSSVTYTYTTYIGGSECEVSNTYEITAIGREAFKTSQTSSLRSVVIPPTVTVIKDHAFAFCQTLSKVTLSEGIITIEEYAFQACTNLSFIKIPLSVKKIEKGAFNGCSSLDSICFPDSVTTIENGTFSGCSLLSYVEFGISVTAIGQNAFSDCKSLKAIEIPATVVEIGDWAFSCSALQSITIPSSVAKIGQWAFYGCENLTSVTFEDGLQTIEFGAFADTGISEITFPASLKEISSRWGLLNSDLIITFLSPTPPEILPSSQYGEYDTNEVFNYQFLFVPLGGEDSYRKAKLLKPKVADRSMVWSMNSTEGFGEYASDDKSSIFSVGGVTADGASRMILKRPLAMIERNEANGNGSHPYFHQPFYTSDDDRDSFAKFFNSYLKLPSPKVHFMIKGKPITDPKLTGTIERTDDGFVYTAPEDFIVNDEQPNLNYYDLTMEFCIDESTGLALVNQYRTTIRVFRPGLVLLHGLNSDRTCFEVLESLLARSDYNSNGEYENEGRLINMDYNETNQASFDINAKRLGDTLLEMYNNLAEMGIVSSRYDVVGHSMGGLIARTYVQTIKPDGINRIITLNTPHGGSPWAGTLTKAVNDVAQPFTKIAEILKDAVTFDFSKLVDDLTIYKNTSAWYDLSTKSDAIKNLNNNYTVTSAYPPVYAFCSSMTPPVESKSSEDKSWWTVVKEKLSAAVLKLLNPTEALVNFVMEDESDGIVPLYSQTGGLTLDNMTIAYAPFKGPMGFGSDAHHTKTHHWPLMLDIMIQAIRTEKSSKYFCKSYFKPIKMQEPKQYVRSNVGEMAVEAAPEGSFVKINAGFGQTDSVRVADVVLKKSDDIECTMVYAKLDDERYYVEVDEDTLHFAIPNDYHGNLTFLALGKVKDMNALVADEATLTFINDSELQSIYFVDGEQMSIVVGQAVEPVVTAVYDYGEDEGFKAALSTDSPDLLAIEGNKVRGLAEGLCTLTAESGVEGISATIGVRIVPDPSGINSLAASNSGISVYTRGNKLVVDFLNDYDGVFDITIYDASGQQCMARRNFTDRKVGDAYTLDISSLPHGKVYVVSIRMKQGTVGYKIFVD